MTTATLILNRAQKEIQSRVDSIEMPSINWKTVCFIAFAMSILLLLFYVWQINGLAKTNYLAGNYEKEINKLSDENKAIQISFAENNFMEYALSKMQELNFQKVVSVKYIHVLDHSAVSRK